MFRPISAFSSHGCRSLGSDTGGSVRLPASYCGVYGFKPSYGRISRYGLITYVSSLDTIGLFSRSLGLLAKAFACLASTERAKELSASHDMTFWTRRSLPAPEKGSYRIGIPQELLQGLFPMLSQSFDAMIAETSKKSVLSSKDVTFVPVSIPSLGMGPPVYYMLSRIEAASNLARYDGLRPFHALPCRRQEGMHPKLDYIEASSLNRQALLGKEVQERILVGTHLASAEVPAELVKAVSTCSDALGFVAGHPGYYYLASQVRRQIKKEMEACYRDNDLDALISLTAPSEAPLLRDVLRVHADGVEVAAEEGARVARNGLVRLFSDQLGRALGLSDAGSEWHPHEHPLCDWMTVHANLAGAPAISLPWLKGPSGLPVGVQLMAPVGKDEELLALAMLLDSFRH
jgi:aspartyl-tRNA(Asn)/glutamyl-tRNA(Gln) amidotransferase subunit A